MVLFVSHSSSPKARVQFNTALSNVRMTALLVVIKLFQANDYLRLRINDECIEDVTTTTAAAMT